jgi:zinc finger FYVE domain-containing protein 26
MIIINIFSYLNAINLQIEVTKFLNSCFTTKAKNNIYWQIPQQTPTLFASNEFKINLCCLILLSGETIQDGLGFVIRIIQCFKLNSKLVYCQIASELAKQYNFKEIYNLLKCINESGYTEDLNSSYDECISTCIRVFAASSIGPSNETPIGATNTQQYNKDIDDLIQLIKDEKNKINAYILTGRLKSAYLIAIKMEQVDTVKNIASVAERLGQNLIKDICNKWLEKFQKK